MRRFEGSRESSTMQHSEADSGAPHAFLGQVCLWVHACIRSHIHTRVHKHGVRGKVQAQAQGQGISCLALSVWLADPFLFLASLL